LKLKVGGVNNLENLSAADKMEWKAFRCQLQDKPSLSTLKTSSSSSSSSPTSSMSLGSLNEKILADVGLEKDGQSRSRCIDLKETYHVEPGSSWGTLPLELQKFVLSLKSLFNSFLTSL
jgi:hypothetical protein